MRLFLVSRNNKEIEFYDINNLNEVLVTFPVAPHLPGRLCSTSDPTSGATSGSKLLYEDESKHPHVIRWLDCSTSPPSPATGSNVTHIRIQSGIHDMCCAHVKGRQFLITAHGHKGISGYDASTDKLEWNFEGKVGYSGEAISPQALTTDGRGHLFVCDKQNKCIQMFSVVGGAYLGTVLGTGRNALRKPWRMRWCDDSASLIVVHKKEKYYRVSIVKDVSS